MSWGNCAGALVAFYTKDAPQKWRLSFVRMDYEFSKGKVIENLTPAKRYSYLVGEGEPCNTAKQRLYPVFADDNSNPSLDVLEEAFSVEKVTNEFFNQYREKYIELKEWLESNEDFMNEAELRNFTSEQFAKKLMGQIAFLYFVQKKGWLGVDAIPMVMADKEYKNAFYARGNRSKEMIGGLYIQSSDGKYRLNMDRFNELSDEDESFLASIVKGQPWGTGPKDFMRKTFEGCLEAGDNYFDEYLEPLFYTGLNKKRKNDFYAPLHRRIPFLNGGLFEELDNYEWESNDFAIPNEIFSNAHIKGKRAADGILDIFDRYNFTMSEDEPMEREVAIDPEMLGKVFENLLDVKDRKSKGAFYTPREIVHYMCQETIINYLVTKTGISEQAIRDFILYGDIMKDEDTNSKNLNNGNDMLISKEIFSIKDGVNRLKEVDDALACVKVADLAVGSGAFPLGMLNEIVKARETLSAYMSIGMNAFQKKSFYAFDRRPYDIKVNTIKNCIYACDIDPSAVDIAKLRLWLSVVIDDEVVENAGNGDFNEHTEPKQLPNLDCNIICGNSLMDEYRGNELISESELLHNVSEKQLTIYQGGVDSLLSELIKLQDKLFFTKDHDDKEEIKEQIENIYNQIVVRQFEGKSQEAIDAYYEAIKQPSRPFVLWQLYFPRVFRDNGGFDIVIGNPPYGLLNKKQNQNTSIMADEYELACYKKSEMYQPSKGGMINIFRLFICKSFALLCKKGNLSLIFPMAFMCDLSAKKLRKYVFEKNKIDYIEAFPERDNENKRVFRSAKMSVCILGATKAEQLPEDKFPVRISSDRYVDMASPKTYMSRSDIELIDKDSLTIPLMTPKEYEIILKICRGSKRMRDYSKCYTGEIDLSLNKKYVHLEDKYCRMLRGAQVQKFYITDNISQGDILYLDEELYLKENNSPKSRHHEKNRIVMQGITGVNEKYRLKMTLAEAGVYCANSVNYLLIDEDMYYFLALCNSKLLNWYFAKLSTNSNVNGYEVDNLPIKMASHEEERKVEEIVVKLLSDYQQTELIDELNDVIYKIYELDDNEIDEIEKMYE
jgi:adenine-specific DNA-methyltransferase